MIPSRRCAASATGCAGMAELWRSAAYRIAFAYFAAFALAVAVLGVAVYFAADAAFRGQQDDALTDETAELVGAYRAQGLDDLREGIAERTRSGGVNSFGYALFDGRGRRVFGDLDLDLPELGLRDVMFHDPVEGPDMARALTTPLGDGRVLVVAIDGESVERVDRTIMALFGGAFLLVLLIGAGGALLLGGYLRGKLARIGATAQAITAGDLGRRVAVGARGDEFDEVARSLNAMLDRTEQLLENLRQVSGDIAHDLRTPLARLRAGLEAALNGPSDPVRQRAALEEAVRQSDGLLALFTGILRIAEVEGGEVARGFQPLDAGALVADLCDSFAPAVADGGRRLACRVAPDLWIRGDRELVAQALVNLLDNAQAHTPAGTSIALKAGASRDQVRLTVADDGPGVPAGDRDRILRRFVRLERSRSAPGHGLGLNLVAAIARAHGGELVVGDNAPGLRAAIVLPRMPA